MQTCQPGILAPLPTHARYMSFILMPGADVPSALLRLAPLVDGNRLILGLGSSLVSLLGGVIPGLRGFQPLSRHGLDIPATPTALWLWVRGDDRGDLLHLCCKVAHALGADFTVEQVVDAFKHGDSRDLSGYEDGTENPKGDEAIAAACVQGQGHGLDGSSFVAVQQWCHDLDRLQAMSEAARDNVIGRHLSDNEEFDEAPVSAHVKRAAQESYRPEAFVLRRSMPWNDGLTAGLMFIAFGKDLDAYEAILNRMTGGEDGIVDGLFSFTRPLTGAYYWCPPMQGDQLDLSALGL